MTFRRLTSTDERGAFVLSGDGHYVILAPDENLGGLNHEGNVEIVRLAAGTTPDARQLTDTPNGVADDVWDVELSTNRTGTRVVFSSPRDFGDNSEGNRELYEISTRFGTNISSVTSTPAGVINRRPRVPGLHFKRVAFESNGDLTGSNPDANFEIFMSVGTDKFVQMTDSQGGDDGFGGGNGDPAINADGSVTGFVSNRDLIPAAGGSPGNADRNREIYLANLAETNPSVAELVQVTDTTTASPGSRIENRYPQLSSNGDRLVFNSDLDLGVPGTSLLYFAQLDVPPVIGPPVITSFWPWAAGPGVTVAINGRNFQDVTAVAFEGMPAASFQVVSRQHILSTIPSGATQ